MEVQEWLWGAWGAAGPGHGDAAGLTVTGVLQGLALGGSLKVPKSSGVLPVCAPPGEHQALCCVEWVSPLFALPWGRGRCWGRQLRPRQTPPPRPDPPGRSRSTSPLIILLPIIYYSRCYCSCPPPLPPALPRGPGPSPPQPPPPRSGPAAARSCPAREPRYGSGTARLPPPRLSGGVGARERLCQGLRLRWEGGSASGGGRRA